MQCGRPCSTAAYAMWQPVQYGHHICNAATRAVRPPMQCGHVCNAATRAVRPPMRYDHPCNTATCAIWPSVQYGHPCRSRRRWSACGRCGSPPLASPPKRSIEHSIDALHRNVPSNVPSKRSIECSIEAFHRGVRLGHFDESRLFVAGVRGTVPKPFVDPRP